MNANFEENQNSKWCPKLKGYLKAHLEIRVEIKLAITKKWASLKTGKPDRERKTGHSSDFWMILQCPVFSVFLPLI